MNHHLLILLGGALVCLVGVFALGSWMLAEQKREQMWAERREQTIGGYLKPKLTTGPTLMLSTRSARKPTSAISQMYALIGWREDRRNQYPMAWWGVMLVTLGPATIAGLLGTKVIGTAGWVLVIGVDLLLTRLFLKYCTTKVSRELLSQFPDALSMVSRSVRVGVPLGEAIKVVAREGLIPTREEFARASDAVAIGVDIEGALVEMAERNDLAEYRFFATALALQSQTGGGLTETLDTLADTIRKREAARKRGSALASEAKTSIYVLVALPIVTGVMLYLSSPEYIGILFTTEGGEKLLGIAVGMLCMGLFTMQQIIKRSLGS